MKKDLLASALKALLQDKKRFRAILFFLVLSNSLFLSVPLLFRFSLNYLPTLTWPSQEFFFLLGWLLFLLGLVAIASWSKVQMRLQFLSWSLAYESLIKNKLFQQLQTADEPFFDQHPTSSLLHTFTQDMEHLRHMCFFGLFAPLNFLTLMIPAFLLLLSFSWKMALISALPLLLIPLLMFLLMQWFYQWTLLKQESLSHLSRLWQESALGILWVKAYQREHELASLLARLAKKVHAVSVKLSILECTYFPLFVTITRFITASLTFFAAFLAYTQASYLSAADFLAFMWIQSYLFFPILLLSWSLPLLEKGRASLERILQLIEEKKTMTSGDISLTKAPLIEAKNLSFSYHKEGPVVLKELNFTLHPKEHIGITGPVGSGKSTLMHLLAKHYLPEPATLFMDKIPVEEVATKSLQKLLAFLEETPFLLSRTVLENVQLAKEEASLEEIERALRLAGLYQTIEQFPDTYQTLVGERGVTLSGGQKSRLTIARALLAKKPILLIDDLLSSLDAQTEQAVFSSLLEETKETTLILVTHKAKWLDQMDRILFLQEGRLVQNGTPQDLRQVEGPYQSLCYLQEELTT